MSARYSMRRPGIRLNCDRCGTYTDIVTTDGTDATIDEARAAANAEHGWTNDGFADLCPRCTLKALRRR